MSLDSQSSSVQFLGRSCNNPAQEKAHLSLKITAEVVERCESIREQEESSIVLLQD